MTPYTTPLGYYGHYMVPAGVASSRSVWLLGYEGPAHTNMGRGLREREDGQRTGTQGECKNGNLGKREAARTLLQGAPGAFNDFTWRTRPTRQPRSERAKQARGARLPAVVPVPVPIPVEVGWKENSAPGVFKGK